MLVFKVFDLFTTTFCHLDTVPEMMPCYSIGEKVYAKVKGFRPWPAIITDVKILKKDRISYRVQFYGTRQWAYVSPGKVWPFQNDLKNVNYKRNRKFERALREIKKEMETPESPGLQSYSGRISPLPEPKATPVVQPERSSPVFFTKKGSHLPPKKNITINELSFLDMREETSEDNQSKSERATTSQPHLVHNEAQTLPKFQENPIGPNIAAVGELEKESEVETDIELEEETPKKKIIRKVFRHNRQIAGNSCSSRMLRVVPSHLEKKPLERDKLNLYTDEETQDVPTAILHRPTPLYAHRSIIRTSFSSDGSSPRTTPVPDCLREENTNNCDGPTTDDFTQDATTDDAVQSLISRISTMDNIEA